MVNVNVYFIALMLDDVITAHPAEVLEKNRSYNFFKICSSTSYWHLCIMYFSHVSKNQTRQLYSLYSIY